MFKITHDMLQSQIVSFCRTKNIYCIANRNESSKEEWQKAKVLGILPGASDLEVKIGDIHLFLELKVGQDKQRLSQKDFQKYVESFGYKYFIIKSFLEFKELLNEYIDINNF